MSGKAMIELHKARSNPPWLVPLAVLAAGLALGMATAVSAGQPRPEQLAKTNAQQAQGIKPKPKTAKAQQPQLHKAKQHPATPPRLSVGEQLGLRKTRDPLQIRSSAALIVDQRTGEVLHAKNADAALPIASLTKLMTALIVISAAQPLDEVLEITSDDIDTEKNTYSRLPVGTRLTRKDMLLLALMSSENRAASALGRHYPGGTVAFLKAMNLQAQTLGMKHSLFADTTGLSPRNVATAADLVRLAQAAYKQPLIRDYSTRKEHTVRVRKQPMRFGTSNRLVRGGSWSIGLQKTGFTNEAGRCLVMQTKVDGRPLTMVFLDSTGTLTRYGDAGRVRQWLQQRAIAGSSPPMDIASSS